MGSDLHRLVADVVARVDDREPLVVVVGCLHDCVVTDDAPAVAVGARALGARVRIVGCLGDGPTAEMLHRDLVSAGVDASYLVTDGRPGGSMAERLARAIRCADAAVVHDDGRLRAEDLVPMLDRDRPRTVVLDAHDAAPWWSLRPELLVPRGDGHRATFTAAVAVALAVGTPPRDALLTAGAALAATTDGTPCTATTLLQSVRTGTTPIPTPTTGHREVIPR
ncbi:hypothetical protein [Curtobacterium sp. 1544]|jgi:hypothetical protein|uniref:hypothetical protein n=1 Tax=Curtobacterium sp. 1544 TaxID=3156417 RepID=UPI003396E5EC